MKWTFVHINKLLCIYLNYLKSKQIHPISQCLWVPLYNLIPVSFGSVPFWKNMHILALLMSKPSYWELCIQSLVVSKQNSNLKKNNVWKKWLINKLRLYRRWAFQGIFFSNNFSFNLIKTLKSSSIFFCC